MVNPDYVCIFFQTSEKIMLIPIKDLVQFERMYRKPFCTNKVLIVRSVSKILKNAKRTIIITYTFYILSALKSP